MATTPKTSEHDTPQPRHPEEDTVKAEEAGRPHNPLPGEPGGPSAGAGPEAKTTQQEQLERSEHNEEQRRQQHGAPPPPPQRAVPGVGPLAKDDPGSKR
jgi:hypothetical protein